MKTVILCGGYGTRIRDVADDIPKPMIPIGGRPILWHVMKHYASHGFADFILCVGYKGDTIRDFFLEYETRVLDFTVVLGKQGSTELDGEHAETGWKVTIAETGLRTMTGGRLARVRKHIGDDEDFFLTYGDGIGTVDIADLYAFHKQHGKALTITGVRPPGRFGELEHDDRGLVTGFNEKPQTTAGRISAGYFVCRRDVFDVLGDDADAVVLEESPIRTLVAAGEVAMYRHDGFWHPMDTARDHALLTSLADRGEAPWIRW